MPCQQSEVYAAEDAVSLGRLFESAGEAEAYLTELRDAWWWRRYALSDKLVHVEVHPGKASDKGWSTARYDAEAKVGVIVLSEPCERTLLHELAHVIASARFGDSPHDPWWARTRLELEYCVRGSDAYEALVEAYAAHDVDYLQDAAVESA